jgi:N6-L-threonylcarbamoyladenine synthase
MEKDICILGIETSCDDTCASVVLNGNKILSNVVASQNEIHAKYGGIVPELASRKHIEVIDVIIKEALSQAGIGFENLNAVSVTNRPGLVGSLLVGAGAAKAIAYAKKIPLIGVNHLKAHLFSNFLVNPEKDSKYIGLIVSGGHSSIFIIEARRDFYNIRQIGHTVDDAAGEAFDKIARFLDLGYPGGPVIDRLAKKGNPAVIDIPRPMLKTGDFNFSFSGLKTSIIYKTKKEPELLHTGNVPDLVASFQEAVVDVLVEKTVMACKSYKCGRILVSGGVAANSRLREVFSRRASAENLEFNVPPLQLCVDNAAMVACLGYYEYKQGNFSGMDMEVYSKSDL